jgi:ketosteroid isomerase-like protein
MAPASPEGSADATFPAMNRSLTYATTSRDGTGEGNLVVRRGRHADTDALATLAKLDSARALTGERVVAEVDGRIVAAVSLHDGRVIADPFVATADAVEVLRLHTAGGRSSAARPRRGFPRLAARRLSPRLV